MPSLRRPDGPEARKQRRPRTVALLGADGSGKTTVARALLDSPPIPLKYLYMGANIESSNVALPTSRLAHWWKVYQHRRSLRSRGAPVPEEIHLHGIEHRIDRRGKFGATLRLMRRVSEACYRQMYSWLYQLQGFVVLYDRHVVFDSLPAPANSGPVRVTERIYRWFLRTLYPRPDLAIALVAPAPVLLARKREVPLERLERDQERILSHRDRAEAFVCVDADQPLEDVIRAVRKLIAERCSRA